VTLAPATLVGERLHMVRLIGQGPTVPDGEGGWTQGPVALAPEWWLCRLQPATVADLQRLTAGTAVTNASFIARGPYHPGITTDTEIEFAAATGAVRRLYVNGVISPDERGIETVAFCEERQEPA
jgi:hypothetical protein